ncbi:conserved Plasmodium protein, unknown function [Plasmodium ovale]|uniref:Uncharacterized protein n=2 Tax=Plasmodium ovale TaxID=36330 RepID=A0A1A8W1J3_PLAOA|nr:conserved Plasmodium protein, unknown function [Plasmodium ovale curtisi]SBS95349.1 conserved Plasmodium protein, unknown function [Plasmodium ovale curtisi]SCP05179.1 conserved Plasmodium protein, unknown function [Plasmodium ovale]
MFNYFLKSVQKCRSKADVNHLSRQFLKNIYLFNTYEISLCLNKFSKVNFDDKAFWIRVCLAITASSNKKIRDSSSERNRDNEVDGKDGEKRVKWLTRDSELREGRRITPGKKIIEHFNIEELCLILNALAKVNVRNEEILKLASRKIIEEIDLNRHVVNTFKAIGHFARSETTQHGMRNESRRDPNKDTNSNISKDLLYDQSKDTHSNISKDTLNDTSKNVLYDQRKDPLNNPPKGFQCGLHLGLRRISKNYDKVTGNLTERDISVLIEVMLSQRSSISEGGELLGKLVQGLKRVQYISEQSIALILNAYSKSLERDKALLDVLKIIIILKIKREKNKCSDIFISSVTHSFSSFFYKDRLLFNTLAEYICKNVESMSVKALIIILNSFVNIDIVNVNMFQASINKLAYIDVINRLSNQCMSNLVTILTKSYNYLDKKNVHFILSNIVRKIKREFNIMCRDEERNNKKGFSQEKKLKKNEENYVSTNSVHNVYYLPVRREKTYFILSFLTKHLTNILNNLSKLNYADANLFAIFSNLLLRNKNHINKLDFLNITSSYARYGYINAKIFHLIKTNSDRYLSSKDLKYVEFINLFTSHVTFYLIEKNQIGDTHCKLDSQFGPIVHRMINMLRGGSSGRSGEKSGVIGEKSGVIGEKSGVIGEKSGVIGEKSDVNGGNSGRNEGNYAIIRGRDILGNLSVNHVCTVLSTLGKLAIHDKLIYEQCIKNIKKKIFKMNAKCLSIYLLYVSRFNLTPDNYIRMVLSNCFKVGHRQGEEITHKKKEKYDNSLIAKMTKLYVQLQTDDIVNCVYIVRALIKNDFNYRSNTYIIYTYLRNMFMILRKKQRDAVDNSLLISKDNVVKIDLSYDEEKETMKERKLNVQSACILINSLSFLYTHMHPSQGEKDYQMVVSFLLLYTFQFIFLQLHFNRSLNNLLHATDDKTVNDVKYRIKKRFDSASLRQLYMTMLMLYYLYPINCIYPKKEEVQYMHTFPMCLLKYIYFFLKHTPHTQFERYSSIYNSVNTKKKLTNYENLDWCRVVVGKNCHVKEDITSEATLSVSNNELVIRDTIVNILKRKKRIGDCRVFATFPVYMYTIDIVVLREGS